MDAGHTKTIRRVGRSTPDTVQPKAGSIKPESRLVKYEGKHPYYLILFIILTGLTLPYQEAFELSLLLFHWGSPFQLVLTPKLEYLIVERLLERVL